jgi:hypothetical protein
MSSSTVPDTAADLVGGRYRLLELIGAGGMGRVWLAQDELLQRRVAVKEIVIPDDIPASELLALQMRTMREARAAARLDHPHLVGVFDVIWRPDRSWIVMEYVPSRSLHQVVRDNGPLKHREAAKIGLGVLRALRAAHGAGVLHRDVKPQNVLITDDGRVVLSDFGVATFDGAGGTADPVMGSPLYVAPERLRNAGPGTAADLWSLGATLYAAVEGRPPFGRSSTMLSLVALMGEPPDPPRHPGPLHAMINDLLVKDPARRMTAEDAEEALRRIAERTVGIFRPPQQRRLKAPPPDGSPVIGRATATSAPAGSAVPRNRGRFGLRRVGLTRVRLRHAGLGLAVGAVLAGTGAAAAILLPADERPVFRPAASVACGAGGALTPRPGTPPYVLPSGWVWHSDPAGFDLALPGVWTRSAALGGACFADAPAAGTFTVDTRGPSTSLPLQYWQAVERAALADGSLPGYELVGMGVLALKQGGADWEYSWQPATGPRLHARRVLLSVDDAGAYLLQWTTPDANWTSTVPVQQRVVDSITPS